jgi:hypothetical protein
MAAAGAAQARQVGLGEALVFADQRRGEVDVFDQAGGDRLGERERGLAACRTRRVDDRRGDVVERLGAAAAEIEDAARLGMGEEPEVDGDDVVDEDEVARLLAGAVAAVGAEEADPAFVAQLVEVMERDRRHAPLVLLVRAVDVEIPKAGDLGGGGGQHAPHDVVEQQLRVAVDVERALELGLLAKRRCAAIDRRRRRVEQAHALRLAGVEQGLRGAVVEVEHQPAVVLHRVGAGALVEDDVDAAQLAALEAAVEIAPVEVVADRRAGEVGVFRAVAEIVDGDDVVDADRVQAAQQVGADHARRSGDDDSHGASFAAASSS